MKKTKSSSVVNEITDTANDVYSRIKKKKAPELKKVFLSCLGR
jgi:hypothetical protein